MKNPLLDDLRAAVEMHKPKNIVSFLDGYLAGAQFWHIATGEGISAYSIRELKCAILEYLQNDFPDTES